MSSSVAPRRIRSTFTATGCCRSTLPDRSGRRPSTSTARRQTTLVTNTGTIQADGGTVLLTASAVDGVVQNLVTAGGKIFASSVGDKTGTIVLGGTGGSLMVAGTLTADGRAPGTIGAVMLPPAVSVAFPVRSSTTLLALMLLARSRLGHGS